MKAGWFVIPSSDHNPLSQAIERARLFDGKRNQDWTPFLTTFDALTIPDMMFCLVPVGSFQMGTDEPEYAVTTAEPMHPQTIAQPYTIAQYPVTNAQWAMGVAAGAVAEPEGIALNWYRDSAMADAPVAGVNWFSAQKFAAWLGCRLPTEAEWEYAARGVESLLYPWGNEWQPDWCVGLHNSGGKPWSVQSKPEDVSWVGARHLTGNVAEWTNSRYKRYPYHADDGREETTGKSLSRGFQRVLRGGSWELAYPPYFRASFRTRGNPDEWLNKWGFRLARSVD